MPGSFSQKSNALEENSRQNCKDSLWMKEKKKKTFLYMHNVHFAFSAGFPMSCPKHECSANISSGPAMCRKEKERSGLGKNLVAIYQSEFKHCILLLQLLDSFKPPLLYLGQQNYNMCSIEGHPGLNENPLSIL